MECEACGGTGNAETELYEGVCNCFECHGSGRIEGMECYDCGGWMPWCSACETFTQTCCVDYGTCLCS